MLCEEIKKSLNWHLIFVNQVQWWPRITCAQASACPPGATAPAVAMGSPSVTSSQNSSLTTAVSVSPPALTNSSHQHAPTCPLLFDWQLIRCLAVMSFVVLHSGLIDKIPTVKQVVSNAALLHPCDYSLNIPVNQICGHCVNMARSSGAARQQVDRQITLKWDSCREALTEKGNKALFGCLSWREVENWHYFVSSTFKSIHLDGVCVGR